MVKMEKLNNAKSVLGMDDPYYSMYYRDIPDEYKISNFLVVPDDRELTLTILPKLLESLEMFYSDFEIVGQTLEDFKRLVQISYNLNGETFERVLSVYDDDIAYPILGRNEIVTYDITDTDNAERSESNDLSTRAVTSDLPNYNDTETVESSRSDIATTNPSENYPSETSTSTNTHIKGGSGTVTQEDEGSHTTNENENRTVTKKGTITTELSDLGVRPNYENLNGFIDNNRTAEKLFIDIFRDCFTLMRCYIW